MQMGLACHASLRHLLLSDKERRKTSVCKGQSHMYPYWYMYIMQHLADFGYYDVIVVQNYGAFRNNFMPYKFTLNCL